MVSGVLTAVMYGGVTFAVLTVLRFLFDRIGKRSSIEGKK